MTQHRCEFRRGWWRTLRRLYREQIHVSDNTLLFSYHPPSLNRGCCMSIAMTLSHAIHLQWRKQTAWQHQEASSCCAQKPSNFIIRHHEYCLRRMTVEVNPFFVSVEAENAPNYYHLLIFLQHCRQTNFPWHLVHHQAAGPFYHFFALAAVMFGISFCRCQLSELWTFIVSLSLPLFSFARDGEWDGTYYQVIFCMIFLLWILLQYTIVVSRMLPLNRAGAQRNDFWSGGRPSEVLLALWKWWRGSRHPCSDEIIMIIVLPSYEEDAHSGTHCQLPYCYSFIAVATSVLGHSIRLTSVSERWATDHRLRPVWFKVTVEFLFLLLL